MRSIYMLNSRNSVNQMFKEKVTTTMYIKIINLITMHSSLDILALINHDCNYSMSANNQEVLWLPVLL